MNTTVNRALPPYIKKSIWPLHGRMFTLVELLVVIAIVSILASILLPSINKAVSAGYSVSCLSQLQQTNQSVSQYCQDFRQIGYIYKVLLGSGTYESQFWPQTLKNSGYLPPVEKSVYYRCPIWRGSIEYTKTFGLMRTSLSVDVATGGGTSITGLMHPARFRRPSSTIMLGDSVGSGGGEQSAAVTLTWNNLHMRHDYRSNVLFADGHGKCAGENEIVDNVRDEYRAVAPDTIIQVYVTYALSDNITDFNTPNTVLFPRIYYAKP